ncbi:predicted protein [Histoplasma capsulatum H143]|uniref:Uncharacterized protein n=1 Tax=Ajellomyces capsulatus (strain H143) TaxID=544712 RepID=C6HDP5_AJECH|nr:predicted protein [Histoplasma capsulatum H143]
MGSMSHLLLLPDISISICDRSESCKFKPAGGRKSSCCPSPATPPLYLFAGPKNPRSSMRIALKSAALMNECILMTGRIPCTYHQTAYHHGSTELFQKALRGNTTSRRSRKVQ